jgi:hypothetical protein
LDEVEVATISTVHWKVLRLLAAGAVVAGLITIAPAAQGRSAANPQIRVQFSLTGTITVTGPTGVPLGTTSGSPPVIPAGYYTLLLLGPGGCAVIPYFELHGPGENVANNLTEGELDNDSVNLYLQPNSTYTWRNRDVPGSVFTFVTSSEVQGTAPPVPGPKGNQSANHTTVKSTDLVGSDILPFRGTVTAAVNSAGRLSLAYKGKSIGRLNAGRYTIAVTDRSTTSGFMLQKLRHTAMNVTGRTFVGKKSAKVALTPGKWVFTPSGGKQAYTIAVVAAV